MACWRIGCTQPTHVAVGWRGAGTFGVVLATRQATGASAGGAGATPWFHDSQPSLTARNTLDVRFAVGCLFSGNTGTHRFSETHPVHLACHGGLAGPSAATHTCGDRGRR